MFYFCELHATSISASNCLAPFVRLQISFFLIKCLRHENYVSYASHQKFSCLSEYHSSKKPLLDDIFKESLSELQKIYKLTHKLEEFKFDALLHAAHSILSFGIFIGTYEKPITRENHRGVSQLTNVSSCKCIMIMYLIDLGQTLVGLLSVSTLVISSDQENYLSAQMYL